VLDINQIPLNNNLVIPSLESNKTLDINGTLIIRNLDNTLTVNGVNYQLGSSFIIGNIQFTLSGIGSPVVLTTSPVPSSILSSVSAITIPPSIARYWTPSIPNVVSIQTTTPNIQNIPNMTSPLQGDSSSVVNNITYNNIDNRQDNRQDNRIDNRQENVNNRQSTYPIYKSAYVASDNQNNGMGNLQSKRLYIHNNNTLSLSSKKNQSSFNSEIMTLINTGVDLLSSRLSQVPPKIDDIDETYDSNLLRNQYIALGNINGTQKVSNVNTLISTMYNFVQIMPNSPSISDVISMSYDLLSNNVVS
jgi:hypothetical protein